MVMAEYDYDVALSFAGEDRAYVEEVANILHQLGVKVFYDRYEEADLWGKNLYAHLDEVYQRKSKYCVVFISKHYKEKLWTNHERESAQARAIQQNSEYILPARLDDTEIPGIRLTTGYVDLTSKTPSELAYLITQKLGLNVEIEEMIAYLKQYLGDYEITVDGADLHFYSEVENFRSYYPLRLMLEMYRADELFNMFILPALVPH